MSKFKVGDVVRYIGADSPYLTKGDGYMVKWDDMPNGISVTGDNGKLVFASDAEFALATPVIEDPALTWMKAELTHLGTLTYDDYSDDSAHGHEYAIMARMLREVYGLQVTVVPASVTFAPVVPA